MGCGSGHNGDVASSLSRVPVEKRKQLAATLGLFSVLCVAVAAVSATGPDSVSIRVFMTVGLVAGVVLALMAWGVANSIRLDKAEAEVDAAIEAAVGGHGPHGAHGQLCGCGHQHDPDELHITDAEPEPSASCAADGHGHDCTHSCDTCVLAAHAPVAEPHARGAPAGLTVTPAGAGAARTARRRAGLATTPR